MGDQQGFPQSKPVATTMVASDSSPPLIGTKIRVPRRRKDLLARPRLVNFLHRHLDRKLILISAPAGYGKTFLLTDFAHDTDLPVCWYTLDAFDRDLHVFLEHLIAAMAQRFPAFGQRTGALLRETADPGSNLYPLVASLVQEIYDTIPEYFFLILDDHHAVEDQEQINEFLDLFVTYVDEHCHLVMASRTLLALPNLSLLVARRQATGISIDELRFTPQEIQALARQNYEVELSAEQASQLAERTGGWITGLLLTTAHRWEGADSEVAIRGRIDINIYDYLSQQVLERQPAPLRDFLLASSVLDELSPELCGTVLRIDSPDDLMAEVQSRNLFVIEFEDESGRLRYHDLFREFLQDALRRQDQARFRDLTLRAASAYAERGEWERAVSRYLSLEQYEPVVDVLGQTGAELFNMGHWDTLASWIDALPEALRAVHPHFAMYRGKIHMERGEHAQALALFDRAEAAFHAEGDDTGRTYALATKGHVLRFQGRYTEAISHSRQALQLLEDTTNEQRFLMALARRNEGLCMFWQGQTESGQRALQQALQLYESLGSTYDVAVAHHDLGITHELTGDLGEAIGHYHAALKLWQELGNPGPEANTLNSLGVVYYVQGRYEEAAKTLDEALAKNQKAGDLRVQALIWASLGDLHSDLGAHERARQAFSQALEVATRAQDGFTIVYALNALGNLARLRGDRVQSRRQLQQALEMAQEHGSDYEAGMCHTSLGILANEEVEPNRAWHHLDQAVAIFEAGGLRRELARACLHRAQVAFLAGDGPAALSDLQRALNLAEQLGSDQFLVVEGGRLTRLLHYAREQELGEGTLPGLLARIEAHRARVAARPEPVVRAEGQRSLEIRALGQPQVALDGEGIQWTTTQSRDLLFCLLQHGEGLRKEELGSIFWPDHQPHKLDAIFRSSLYRLRRATYREIVIYEDGLYRFNRECPYWFDVRAFEHSLYRAERATTPESRIEKLEEALRLYRGDYLDGVYADWCALERQRLRERHLNAHETLGALYAGGGEFQRAVEQYQHLVAQDPYREAAHRELMRCHYRLGDRIAAVRQYQSYVEILRDDLGLGPAEETEALYLQIIG
jgi:LuxR family maltose regulon positive regulatory protein